MSLPKRPANRRFLTHLFNSLASPLSPDALNQDYPSPLDSAPDTVKKQLLALQVLFPNEFVPALDVLDRQLVTRFRIRDEQQAHHEDDVVMVGVGDEREIEEEAHINDDTKLNENEHTRKTTTSGTTTQYLSITDEEATTTSTSTDAIPPPAPPSTSLNNSDTTPTVYYVRSAQHHRSSRYTTTTSNNTYDPTPNYQVRLSAWHCSCPAFTFAAFPTCPSPDPDPDPSSVVPVDPFQTPQHLDHSLDREDDGGDDEDDDDDAGTWSFGGISLGDDMPPVCKHLLACLLADKCSRLFGDKLHERWVSSAEAAGWAAGWGD